MHVITAGVGGTVCFDLKSCFWIIYMTSSNGKQTAIRINNMPGGIY